MEYATTNDRLAQWPQRFVHNNEYNHFKSLWPVSRARNMTAFVPLSRPTNTLRAITKHRRNKTLKKNQEIKRIQVAYSPVLIMVFYASKVWTKLYLNRYNPGQLSASKLLYTR